MRPRKQTYGGLTWISFVVEPPIAAALNRWADNGGMTRSELLRRVLYPLIPDWALEEGPAERDGNSHGQ